MKILAIQIKLANAVNQNQFVYFTQFSIEELKTYSQVMQDQNSAKQTKAMEEKLNQLHKIRPENLSTKIIQNQVIDH